MHAAILETDVGFGHQLPDRARSQDLARARLGGEPRADMKGQADRVGPAHLVFAGMQSRPDFQAQRAHRFADGMGALHPGRRRGEGHEHPVARRHDFLAMQGLQFLPDGRVIMIHHLRPARITQSRGLFRGLHDVDDQDGGQRLLECDAAIGGPAADRDARCQRLVAVAASSRDRALHVVVGGRHRLAADLLLARRDRPVDLASVAHAFDLDGAPLQENRRAGPANAPCLRRIAGHIRLMDADAKELGHVRTARPFKELVGRMWSRMSALATSFAS